MRSVLVVNLPAVVELLISCVGDSLPALQVTTANSGRESLALTRRKPFSIDLALVNNDLIDLTWREFTRELEAESPGIPVVVCLPSAKRDTAGRIERLGHRVLWMPVQAAGLRDVVLRYLSPEVA